MRFSLAPVVSLVLVVLLGAALPAAAHDWLNRNPPKDLALRNRSQRPDRVDVGAVFQEPDRTIAHQDVGTPGVVARHAVIPGKEKPEFDGVWSPQL